MPAGRQNYIGGRWRAADSAGEVPVVDPATEDVVGHVAISSAQDVARAVESAAAAFLPFSQTSPKERAALLRRLGAALLARTDDIAQMVSREMGAPIGFARTFHVSEAANRFEHMADVVDAYPFSTDCGTTTIMREAVGVCAAITPWNVPIVSLAGKIAPALAAGCTVIAKPSEVAPFGPAIMAEIVADAGVPAGVINILQGDGATTGSSLVAHPDVELVNFTGSTRAGIAIGRAGADTVKRLLLELGGKSPNILMPGVDLETVVTASVRRSFVGSGQSCQAPTRLLVPRGDMNRVLDIAQATAESFTLGDPFDPAVDMGPVASGVQFAKIQELIASGIAEGATLAAGGLRRPPGISRGYFVRPTILGNVERWMRVAREEIFGPVLSVMAYDDEEDALAIANDTEYGLAAWVYASDRADARRVGARIRAGRVYLNGSPPDPAAPFGGYKRSGNSREGGIFGLESHLEIKALLGTA